MKVFESPSHFHIFMFSLWNCKPFLSLTLKAMCWLGSLQVIPQWN